MFSKLIFLLIIVTLQLINLTVTEQPYQVTIWLKNDIINKNLTAKPLCNGVVIHERLILTTATCLRNKTNLLNDNSDTTDSDDIIINTTNLTKPAIIEITTPESIQSILSNPIKFTTLNASDIVILSGNNNINNINNDNLLQKQKRIITNISEIHIGNNFNITSLENDIALLKLNESLPLSTRRDIQWIILDDHTPYKNISCKIGFSNLMTKNIQENHTVKLMNNKNCTNTTSFQSPRKEDICSLYVNPSICDLSTTDFAQSVDRGTGLVCDSKLIGVLSQIIPKENNTKCSNADSFKAIYTRVANHLNWIYEKIAIESMADLGKSNYILAPQYKESAPSPSIQMPQYPEPTENSIRSESTPATKITNFVTTFSSGTNQMNHTEMEETTKQTLNKNLQNSKSNGKSFGNLSKSISLQVLSMSMIVALVTFSQKF